MVFAQGIGMGLLFVGIIVMVSMMALEDDDNDES